MRLPRKVTFPHHQVLHQTPEITGFVTTCSPPIHPPLSWCSSAPGVQERVRREIIEHAVPGVPVTPLDLLTCYTHALTHGLGKMAEEHANIKVGIYGLALNPKRWKFGWPPAKQQVGGKKICWPSSWAQPLQGYTYHHPHLAHAATLTPFRCVGGAIHA